MSKTTLILLISIAYITGLVCFFIDNFFLLPILFLILIFVLIFYKKINFTQGIVIFLFFTFGIFNAVIHNKETDDLKSLAPFNELTIQGQILSIPKNKFNGKTKFYFKVEDLIFKDKIIKNIDAKSMVNIIGDNIDFTDLKIGNKIQITGKLRQPTVATIPSQFDYSKYLKNTKTFTTFYANDIDFKLIETPNEFYWKFLKFLDNFRQKIMDRHAKYIKSPRLEILGGIVFGNEAINPPDDIKQSFVSSGLLHLLAASGLNVALICSIWLFIARQFRINYRFSIFFGMFLIILYLCMTGFPPSVVRAGIMIEFVLFGKLLDRDADSFSLIAFVAMLMLIFSPTMLFDVGFQLSFLVTFGLILCVEPIVKKFDKIPIWLLSAILVPLIAQIWVAPLQMYYFNTFTKFSLFANICVLPFITAISFLGFVSSIFAGFNFTPNFVISGFDFITDYLLNILVIISNFFANIKDAVTTTFQPTIFQIIIYYSIIISIIFAIKADFKNRKINFFIIFISIFFMCSFLKFNNNNLEIIAFDVQNADSFLIKTPQNKYIMIDTAKAEYNGVSQANLIMKEYLKDNSIKRLDLLILTHFDSDHAGGTIDILKDIKSDKIILGSGSHNSVLTNKILKYIKDNNLNSCYAINGEVSFSENDFTIKTFQDLTSKDDNAKSLVNLLEYKDFKMLFMGDAGINSFENISNKIPKVSVLKVGHHGAKNVIDKNMLDKLTPEVCLISVGYNQYNHPNYKTINFIKGNAIKIFRTDLQNAIKIEVKKDRYEIFSFDSLKNKFLLVFSAAKKKT